jgi:NtrC-family two-component system response regulator AlgB
MNRDGAERCLKAESFEVAFLDLRLGAESGLDLLPELLRLSPRLAIIVMTSYSSVETAVQAMQRGASDYLSKPFKPSQIEQVLDRVMRTRQLEVRITDLEAQIRPGSAIEISSTSDPEIQKLISIAKKSASSNASILITGESGTGKSVLARQLHKWSSRAREPFITVSCPSLSRDLFESDLFGHVKGAFTGAVSHTEAASFAARTGVRAARRIEAVPRRCADHRGDESRSEKGGGTRHF